MSTPRLVVLGAAGMLGHKLFQVLRDRFPGVVATTRESMSAPPLDRVTLLQGSDVVTGVDATNFAAVEQFLQQHRPDFVINCIGIIKQRDAAADPIPTITLNSLFPHQLARAAAGWGGRLIHFSTDCVFSGRRGNYTESDPSDAEDLYGRSKFLGEVTAPNALTLRTSIIGRELAEHRSLLEWLLSQRGATVRGFRKVIYSGITTNEMAEVLAMIITHHPRLSGLFHVASQPISKHDLLLLVRDAYSIDIQIEPDDREVSDRSMSAERFSHATGWRAPSWTDMTQRLAADTTPYRAWGVSVL